MVTQGNVTRHHKGCITLSEPLRLPSSDLTYKTANGKEASLEDGTWKLRFVTVDIQCHNIVKLTYHISSDKALELFTAKEVERIFPGIMEGCRCQFILRVEADRQMYDFGSPLKETISYVIYAPVFEREHKVVIRVNIL